MKVEFKENQELNSNENFVENVLVVYITEDIFNDSEYSVGGKKFLALAEEFKKLVKPFIKKLPNVNGTVTFPGVIEFNLNNVPDITGSGKNPKTILSELAGILTEMSLNITLDRKGRRWFRKSGAPSPHVVANEAPDAVQQYIGKDCWGCFGFNTTIKEEYENKNDVCPL